MRLPDAVDPRPVVGPRAFQAIVGAALNSFSRTGWWGMIRAPETLGLNRSPGSRKMFLCLSRLKIR